MNKPVVMMDIVEWTAAFVEKTDLLVEQRATAEMEKGFSDEHTEHRETWFTHSNYVSINKRSSLCCTVWSRFKVTAVPQHWVTQSDGDGLTDLHNDIQLLHRKDGREAPSPINAQRSQWLLYSATPLLPFPFDYGERKRKMNDFDSACLWKNAWENKCSLPSRFI